MKIRTIGFTFAAAMLGVSTSLAIQACSSNDSGTVTTDEDAGTHDTGATTTRPDGSTGGGSDTGTTTPDTGTGTGDDAGPSGNDGSTSTTDASDIPDGGVPVTPGKVQCGGAECDLNANTCCAYQDGGGTCSASACPSGTASIKCAEKADCTGSDVCCGTLNIATQAADTKCASAPCGPANDPTKIQFCRTNSECGAGVGCFVQVCNGVTLELCGHSPLCK